MIPTKFYRFVGQAAAVMCLLALLSSCGTCKNCPRQNIIQRDSIYVTKTETTTIHDTTIMWRIPEGSDSAVLPDSDTSRLQTGLAESEAWVAGGQLHHTLRNRSDRVAPINLQLPEKASTETTGIIREKTVTVEVERELTRWQKRWISMGKAFAGLLLAALAYLAWKLLR